MGGARLTQRVTGVLVGRTTGSMFGYKYSTFSFVFTLFLFFLLSSFFPLPVSSAYIRP
jgi:hypothetical protein